MAIRPELLIVFYSLPICAILALKVNDFFRLS